MALNPEDVIKKSFNATHLRRGYDETQVDDFLDEVVIELRRLHSENDDLSTQLADCRASKGITAGDAESGEATPAGAAALPELSEDDLEALRTEKASLTAELEQLRSQVDGARTESPAGEAEEETRGRLAGELAELQERVELAQAEAEQAEAEAEQAKERAAEAEGAGPEAAGGAVAGGAAVAAVGAAGGSDEDGVEDPTSIITLAQRLHDEHVEEGTTTKEKLIAEGDEYRNRVVGEADQRSTELLEQGQAQHDELVRTGQEQHDELVRTGQEQHDELVRTGQEQHDELVSSGQTQHDTLVAEAEQKRTDVLADLETKKGAMSTKIDELTKFETDYRGRMRSFINEQLGILDRDGDGIPDSKQ